MIFLKFVMEILGKKNGISKHFQYFAISILKNNSTAQNYDDKINIMKNKVKYLEKIAENFGCN